ncbi:MAG: hypothetical protein EU532_00065 [Promethearchaeota archaeon]|nr:MAG: hypothetical protein EU532_00065 [Candidatus Lokiarchaeota archaeon]
MKDRTSNNISSLLNRIVEKFENKKLTEKHNGQYSGMVYTPIPLTEFMVKNIFNIYFEDLWKNFDSHSHKLFQEKFGLDNLDLFLENYPDIKSPLKKKIDNLKILDPACGSGRFLLSAGILILKIYKILQPSSQDFELKRDIIQNVLYGVDLDKSAQIISKLRLMAWLFKGHDKVSSKMKFNIKDVGLKKLEEIANEFNIHFNLFNLDFLLELDSNQKFDFIIGNPPYIENKKILDISYKRKLGATFKSAYRLFDLSILFLEKSLELLKDECGFLSFIMTNKFLAADYGIKIRNILLHNTELKQIINISALPVFIKAASYPIIISLKKQIPNKENTINIQSYKDLNDFVTSKYLNSMHIDQNSIKKLPSHVFPLSGNIELIRYVFSNYKPMSEKIKDLKIIYRPFGFTQWKKFFNNLSESKTSEHDLLLLGTGNVGKFHIKFDKRIRIAKKDIKVSYFNYSEIFKGIWTNINKEKLIFREIAKNLTAVYDPGLYTNITGLYFIKIPSYSTNNLFCLLSILNSKFMDSLFKSLFGTLHMSSGYLRFNGSFIKRLPMPDHFPESLAHVGKINQFLSQLIYDQPKVSFEFQEIKILQTFFIKLADSLVSLLYLKNFFKNAKYSALSDLLAQNQYNFPIIEFKYSKLRHNFPKFKIYEPFELEQGLFSIKKFFTILSNNSQLSKEIKQLISSNF